MTGDYLIFHTSYFVTTFTTVSLVYGSVGSILGISIILNKSISAHECAFGLFVFAIFCNCLCPVFTIHYVVSFTFFSHNPHSQSAVGLWIIFIFTQFMVKSMYCSAKISIKSHFKNKTLMDLPAEQNENAGN